MGMAGRPPVRASAARALPRIWWPSAPPRKMLAGPMALGLPRRDLQRSPGARGLSFNPDKGLSWRGWLNHHLGDLTGKKLIGSDYLGNDYYEIDNPGREPNPKREICYAALRAGKALDDLEWSDVPPEWRLWMTHARKEPPTEEEVTMGKAKRELILQRAAALKADDDRARSKQIAEGKFKPGEGGASSDPIMMIAKHHGINTKGGEANQKPGNSEATGSGQTFKPGAWDPNAMHKEEEEM